MSAPQRVNDKRLSLLRRSVRPRLSNAACLLNFELLENRCVLAATIENFPGLNSPFNPPDPVGDVGPRHYVQMVNATDYQIWDKTGTPLTAPLSLGSLWPLGNVCRTDTAIQLWSTIILRIDGCCRSLPIPATCVSLSRRQPIQWLAPGSLTRLIQAFFQTIPSWVYGRMDITCPAMKVTI